MNDWKRGVIDWYAKDKNVTALVAIIQSLEAMVLRLTTPDTAHGMTAQQWRERIQFVILDGGPVDAGGDEALFAHVCAVVDDARETRVRYKELKATFLRMREHLQTRHRCDNFNDFDIETCTWAEDLTDLESLP
jgi:hypothetical protein